MLSNPTSQCRRSFNPRLQLEHLENRTVPASVTLVGNSVFYQAAAGEENQLSVFQFIDMNQNVTLQFADSAIVTISCAAPFVGGNAPGVAASLPNANNVTKIVITLGDQPDLLWLSINLSTLVTCGTGNDTVNGGEGSDDVNGQGDDDWLQGFGAKDTLMGGDGKDSLYGGNGNDELYGDEKADFLSGGTGSDTMSGGADNDLMWGHEGDDEMLGMAGFDTLHGSVGDDKLWGGTEDDNIFGEEGVDQIRGQAGNDLCIGGAEIDLIWGDADNDWFDPFEFMEVQDFGNGNDNWLA
jgi:hypothetical protein